MPQSGVPTVLGVVAGVLAILGGFIDFILGVAHAFFAYSPGPLVQGVAAGLISTVLGILMLVFTGYSRAGVRDHAMVGGIVLILLGVISWFLLGRSLFVVLAAVLAFLAGLVFLLEHTVHPR